VKRAVWNVRAVQSLETWGYYGRSESRKERTVGNVRGVQKGESGNGDFWEGEELNFLREVEGSRERILV
jgi:hypothetical protein